MFVTLLVFIAVLGLLVFIHELGHFLAARRSGIPVEEFAFGFKPRIYGKQIGQTLYAINLIPLGGYVRLLGEQDNDDDPRAFRRQPVGKRFFVLVAGAVMNLLLGWVVLTILFAVGFNSIIPGAGRNPFIQPNAHITITDLADNSPAKLAGLLVGDQILNVDGHLMASDLDFIEYVNAHKGIKLNLVINRHGQTINQTVLSRAEPPANQGPTGVTIQATGKVKAKSIFVAPLASLYQTGNVIWLSAKGFVGFVVELVAKQRVSEDVTGIVGVGALTGIARRLGLEYLAQLVAIISIGLGVVNVMPILPLDGGHIALLGYEKLVGRPAGEKQLGWLNAVGFGFVMLIFVVVTYRDVIRFNVFSRLF